MGNQPLLRRPPQAYIQHLVNPIGAATINEFLSHQTEWLHNLSVADLNFVRADRAEPAPALVQQLPN